MGLLGKIGSFFKPIGQALLGSFADDKVTGVPTPVQRTGTEIGADYKGFLDTAYPGTTPWEQLGANSPMGAIQSSENTIKQQVKMQERELFNRSAINAQTLDNQSRVADQTNRAHIITSLGALSPQAAQQGLKILDGSSSSPQWNTVTDSHIKKNEAETSKITQGTPETTMRGKIAQGFMDTIAATGQGAAQLSENIGKANSKAANFIANFNPPGQAQIIKAVEDLVYNRGSRPRRFK